MKIALKLPHQVWQVFIALLFITILAVTLSQCPSLGYGKYHPVTSKAQLDCVSQQARN